MKPISEMAITFSTAGTLLGIIIDSELKFENHLNSICNKVSRKINVLGRVINNWVNVELRRKYSTNFNLITVLFYGCCARKISSIIAYSDYTSSFERLLNNGNSFSIHERNVQSLAIEICRFVNRLSPGFLNNVYHKNSSNPKPKVRFLKL